MTPASGRKSADLFPGQQRDDPNLQVVAEDDAGVTVSGMKMLATSAVYADEILIGNLTPIDDKLKSEAITAALPLNAPGVSLWSRQPYAQHVAHEADYPMSYRFDETDSVLVCDRVKIPWERVFLHNDAGDVAAHLHRDAGELLPEPPVQHPVLGEDGPDRRASRAASARPTAPTRFRRCARRSAGSPRSRR